MKKILIFLALFSFSNHLNICAEKNEEGFLKKEDNLAKFEDVKRGGYESIEIVLGGLIGGKELILNKWLIGQIIRDFYKIDNIKDLDLMFLDHRKNQKGTVLNKMLGEIGISYADFITYFFKLVGESWGKDDPRIKIILESYLGSITPVAIEFVYIENMVEQETRLFGKKIDASSPDSSIEIKSSLCETVKNINLETLSKEWALDLMNIFYFVCHCISEDDLRALDYEKVLDGNFLTKILKRAELKYTDLVRIWYEYLFASDKKLKKVAFYKWGDKYFFEFDASYKDGRFYFFNKSRIENKQARHIMQLIAMENEWVQD